MSARVPRNKVQKLKKVKVQDDISKIKKDASKLQKKKFKKQLKKEKIKVDEKISEISRRKRMRVWIMAVCLICLLFIGRIGWIQFVMGEDLKKKAYTQQTLDRNINPRRGTIYDATGKNILAVSSTVNTVTVNPVNISKNDKEKVAHALSDMFELDYDTVLKKVKKRSSIETIVKKIDKEKADELRKWMSDHR